MIDHTGPPQHRCLLPEISGGIPITRPDWECGECGRVWRMATLGLGGWWQEVRGPTPKVASGT